MPTREETQRLAVELIQQALHEHGNTASNAWLAVYRTLLWHESVSVPPHRFLPHIIDADKLRPRRGSKSKTRTIWQTRAIAIEEYLAQAIGCSVGETNLRCDQLFRRKEFEGLQRQNPLGIAFAGVIQFLLGRFGSQQIQYRNEVPADEIFPGIHLPGRSKTPSIDILATHSGVPISIISAKWSLRHDRIGDITSECPAYKNAARLLRSDVKYFVVTNEFDPSRLQKIITDTCVDGVVHIHKPAVTDVCRLNDRLQRLLDLTEFFERVH